MWQLYQFPLCPFSRKIRLLMGEKGVAYDLVREDPWAASDHFLNLNAAGRTPVLVNEEKGITLADSRAIAEYLEETVDTSPMRTSPTTSSATPLAVLRKLTKTLIRHIFW